MTSSGPTGTADVGTKTEWSWSGEPILLPLSFESQEWSSVYAAFYLAECTGSVVNILHVTSEEDDPNRKREFLEEMGKLAESLKIRYRVEEMLPKSTVPNVREIAEIVVSKSVELGIRSIVMSAHKEPFFRTLFGRVSDRVARDARCGVVLVEVPRKGLRLPQFPQKILIPVLEGRLHPEPFIFASSITSSVSASRVEIVALRVVELPPTTPLDAVEESFKSEEKDFSLQIGTIIRSLGRLFVPRIQAVREIAEVADYADEVGADLIVVAGWRPTGFQSLLGKKEQEIVRRASCIVLVVFPPSTENK